MFLFISENTQYSKSKNQQHQNYNGEARRQQREGGEKLARENCISFYEELKNASPLGKSNPLRDLWLREQGQRKGDLRTARQEHRFTHLSACRAQPRSTRTEEFVTPQVREAQTGVSPAPDFAAGLHRPRLGRFPDAHEEARENKRSRTLWNRYTRGEREARNKGGDPHTCTFCYSRLWRTSEWDFVGLVNCFAERRY